MFRNIKYILPILIILIAAFLRFYRLSEFATFLGDQGRDAVILKRIITLEHLPAIGPPSSLGQIYLGPFYYYLVAPFLLLFNFNPIGPAFGVALLSTLGLLLSYFIIKKGSQFETAIYFLVFSSFSFINIQQSRFSWNPNLLPIFLFLTLYFFYKLLSAKNKLYAVAFGALLSFSIQLHHLAFLLFLPITIITVVYLLQQKNPISKYLNILISFIFFLLFSSPLIIFDLRHNFLNTRNFIKFFSEGNPTDHENFLSRFIETNQAFYNHVLQFNVNQYIAVILTLTIFIFISKKFWSKDHLFLQINLLSFISYLVSFSVFNTTRNAHYYGPVYFSFFLILAFLLSKLLKNKARRIFIASFVIGLYVLFNFKNLIYLFGKGGNQIQKAETIAQSILNRNPQSPFQSIALPDAQTDGHIRYFLEIKGKRPLPADTLEQPKEMYVLCFETCQVLGNPQWQIAAFKKAKIHIIWNVEDVAIYKLIHSK